MSFILLLMLYTTNVEAQETELTEISQKQQVIETTIQLPEVTHEEILPFLYGDIGSEIQIIKKDIQELSMPTTKVVDYRETCKEYNMYDKSPLTGFIDDWGFCVPGLVTTKVWFTKSPQYVYGNAVVYSPGMMRATAYWRQLGEIAYGKDSEYLGGVATPSPADIGETVWLRRPGYGWEGPFLVVDCSRRADMYSHIAINEQVVELDFDTAVSWGMAHYTAKWWEIDQPSISPIEVYYGKTKPNESIRLAQEPIFFPEYWLKNVADYQREKIEPTPIIVQFGINPVWNLMDGNGTICFTTACSQE